ncbi:MAG: LON peptidase substrate-binding domain-containing protein [Ignavibacteria bacterium]|nr:LON peptidase substrate-binding domain-containing protein [Ignavibacteria bacterium]
MTLGLFPLNLVLFPHVRVPLHIFEPRYKELMNECLERGSEFGINLVEEGHMHPIGCAARVVEVTQSYPDGRMDVIVEGTRRFRLLELKNNDRPFATGEIEGLDDDDVTLDQLLLNECLEKYNLIVTLVYGATAPLLTHTDLGICPSFDMAPKSGLSTEQKQSLIELSSENQRLEELHEHFTELLPMIRRAEAIQRVVQSDGYLRAIT